MIAYDQGDSQVQWHLLKGCYEVQTQFRLFEDEVVHQLKNLAKLGFARAAVKLYHHFDDVSSCEAREIEITPEEDLVLLLLKEVVELVLDVLFVVPVLSEVEELFLIHDVRHLVQNQLIGRFT